jgi:hypothetical protein
MLLSACILAWSHQIKAQTVLLEDRFDSVTPGGLPGTVEQGGPWTTINAGANTGAMRVVADEGGWFGGPETNRFFKVENGIGFALLAQNRFSSEVVTLSFDMVDRRTMISSAGSERFTIQFYAGDGSTSTANRAHILSLQNGTEIRSGAGTYGAGVRQRWDVVVNNSAATVSYSSPRGTQTLPSGRADVWLDGRAVATNYTFSRQAGVGPIRTLAIQTFSTDRFNFEMDNIVLYQGAHVLAQPAPRPTGARVSVDADQKLVYTSDVALNTIPDFSSAGYMGGGVPIPDVPVRLTLNPAPGDNTSRIQQAINQVSLMPLDENGFRGALLLTAGTYIISNQLSITASGVVLRGEGNGGDGTVLIAAGTSTRPLIVVGSATSHSEVSNSRRSIVDDHLPVGARSFTVDSASGLAVGDQVMIHRPSTAAWIDAIGMNAIPPRSDGLPVTQWAPGAYDLRYDRIITGIQGRVITVDAPLVNSFEKQFGGGSIYRYTWNSRINQVGIENLRAISEYASRNDENHSWECILLQAVRNAWVRQVTGMHFAFSTVSIGAGSKWVTVEDSSLWDPIALVDGSRMYPFYMYGQLALVQRCYARYARHDFSTSSRVCGPNVFLHCSADNSYSDSGPHQRWATGTLYDNVSVPNHDLNVQNRLNFGSGHGWSGANHVVWNSTAKRFAIQNPPTAQNWAIGLKGAKWAGAFPAYAKDGYWESHGTNVLPASLYTQQLAERLSPAGAGGLITIVNFASTNLGVQAGNSIALGLGRAGILDGSRQAMLSVADEHRPLFTPGSFASPVFLPANSAAVAAELNVSGSAWLPQARSVAVRLVNGSGYSAGASNTVHFILPARPVVFANWQAHYFTSQQIDDQAVGGPSASPANDGIPNLIKYAFCMDPWLPRDWSDFPAAVLDQGRLRLTYTRSKWITDVTFRAEVSSDLQTWSDDPAEIEIIEVVDLGDYERLTARDRRSTGETSPRFMRISIVRDQLSLPATRMDSTLVRSGGS